MTVGLALFLLGSSCDVATPFVVDGTLFGPVIGATRDGFTIYATEEHTPNDLIAQSFGFDGAARSRRTLLSRTKGHFAQAADGDRVVFIHDDALMTSGANGVSRLANARGGPFREIAVDGDAIAWFNDGAEGRVMLRVAGTAVEVGQGWIPDVATNAARVVVVWTQYHPKHLPQVLWRMFDAKGKSVTDAQPIAFDVNVEGHNAVVAMAPDGKFVVGWNTIINRTKKGARVRLMSADGKPLTAPIDIDDELLERQDDTELEDITVAATKTGFVVSWLRERGGPGDLMVRYFGWNGRPLTRALNVAVGARRFHSVEVVDDLEIVAYADDQGTVRGAVSRRCIRAEGSSSRKIP